MSSTIWLTGLGAHAHHGVHAFEREQGQRFVLDIGMVLDTRPAARSDAVEETVSYAEVAEVAHAILVGEPSNLLETVAERVAAAVLAFPGVQAVTVVLHKPDAPVGFPFHDVSLTIHRTPLTVVPPLPVQVVLGLGGNMGDVAAHLRAAVLALEGELAGMRVGPLVRTAAMTLPDSGPQDDYLNTVITGHTRLSASEVLDLAHRLEAAAGRVRLERWGPRTLDVDVLAYGLVTSRDPDLVLPHPGAASRPFVVVPWAALEPDREVGGRMLAELAAPLSAAVLERMEVWR